MALDNYPNHFTDQQVAIMLGYHPVTIRTWRKKNKQAGCIKFGPPYEYHGANVLYPKDKFREWCAQVTVVDGVPRMNVPLNAPMVLPDETAQEVANAA